MASAAQRDSVTPDVQRLVGERGLIEAARRLRQGECVALPTETVYGLAADAGNESAIRAVFAAKQRPANHPLIVHIPPFEHLGRWACDVPEEACRLAEAFWPGPLTMLLHKADEVSPAVTGGRDTIALRVPAQPEFLRILSFLETGLAAPSANPYKRLSPTTADQVIDGMRGRIAAVLDAGPCDHGLESTIVDLTGSAPTIVRAGPITRREIEAVLNQRVAMPRSHDVAVPGNQKSHYQPNARLKRLESTRLREPSASAGYLVWSSITARSLLEQGIEPARVVKLPNEPGGFGRGLYAALHSLDQRAVDEIRVEQPPASEGWAAVNDRLLRAES